MRKICELFILTLIFASCGWKTGGEDAPQLEENLEAKALLQGIWIEDETDEVSFRAEGDTIYYPDSTSQPAHFMIEILSVSEVLKMDSVVTFGSERYHWYIAVNPTKYRVVKTTYNSDGVGVDNVYYDNIIHVSLYNGSVCLFSRDFKKQMFEDMIPKKFLEQAILGNMQFDHADARGCHFNATLCIPDGASCYLVDILIGKDGQISMKLLEY